MIVVTENGTGNRRQNTAVAKSFNQQSATNAAPFEPDSIVPFPHRGVYRVVVSPMAEPGASVLRTVDSVFDAINFQKFPSVGWTMRKIGKDCLRSLLIPVKILLES
jgi:hypothetical protein